MRPVVNPPIQHLPPADSLVLSAFSGLKNTVRPERLQVDELEVAINVDLDDAGQPSQRTGMVKLASGAWGSAFNANDGRLFCVKDGALGWVDAAANFHAIVGVGDEARVCWCQVGDTIYWSSQTQNGKIDAIALTNARWGVDEQWLSFAPDTPNTGPVAGRLVGPPPPCRSMCWNGGRIFMAVGSLVWFTDLFNYEVVDRVSGYWPFEGDVVWIGSTTRDVYVGTTEGVWYVGGGTREPRRKRIMDGAATPGSLVTIPAELGNPIALRRKPDQESAIALAFMTTHGYCVAYDDGDAFNLTEGTFLFPQAQEAAATFRQQIGMNQYLVDLKGSGAPSGLAAFGDRVEANVSPLVWAGEGSTVLASDLDRVRSQALLSGHGAVIYHDPGQITPYVAGVEAPLTHKAPSLITSDLTSPFDQIAWSGGLLTGPTGSTALLKVKLTFSPNVTRSEALVRVGDHTAIRALTPPLAGESLTVDFAVVVRLDPVGQAIHMTSSAAGTLTGVQVSLYPLTA